MRKLIKEEFINKAVSIYGFIYNYNNSIYINNKIKLKIICPIDGEFLQTPNDHLYGHGCPKCGKRLRVLKRTFTMKEFVDKAINAHGNRYNYDKVIYKGMFTKVTIICPIHGDFSQTPHHHLNGHGCPLCRASKGELLIAKILDNNKIEYIKQKIFLDCKNPKTNRTLKYDFYLPKYNMLIEFNGMQHYIDNGYLHTNKHTFAHQQYRDSIKQQYALSHGYKFLVIKYTDNIEEKLKEAIKI